MDLPQLSEYSAEELSSKLFIHPQDVGVGLLEFYRWPLSDIIKLINELPPTIHNTHDFETRFANWDELIDGYMHWGIPELLEEDEDENFMRAHQTRKMQLQFWYRGSAQFQFPEIQLGKVLSKPFVKRLKKFSKSPEFDALADKIYVLKVELSPKHSSPKEDLFERLKDPVKVWRLLTCFGDTNLNAFHDQILAPAMGWRRNFHAYQFVVPTNGASIFPQDTTAMDKQHLWFTRPTYSLDCKDYDVRHFLRAPGDRVNYQYDMGDNWCHIISVLDIVEKGTKLSANAFKDIDGQIFQAIPRPYFKEWMLTGSALLWGEINCPPENSEGCDELGRYGTILKKGPDYEVPEAANIINWAEHDIQYAYDFDLEAHQERFNRANAARQNPRTGVLQFLRRPGECIPENDLACMGGSAGKTTVTKVNVQDQSTETTRKKKETTSMCNFCRKVKGTNSTLKLYSCTRCKSVSYCGKDCQKKDRKNHKKDCVQV